ncbi:MAG TPA: hypothetical protein PK796_09775 [Bacteroidales bacterium]|nr:hypothetical protein [Bacteroidales bacterium]
MRKIPFLLFILLLFSSCATLVNSTYTHVNVFTKQDSVKVYLSDSTQFAYTPAQLIVARSKAPLEVTLEKQDLKKTVLIPAKLSPQFIFGNYVNGTLLIGYLIDLSNPKRFKYPSKVHFDLDYLNNANLKYKTRVEPQFALYQCPEGRKRKFACPQGTLSFKLSVPEANSFVINKQTHIGKTFGFLGITCGADYYYKDKQYIGMGMGGLTDFIMPVPAPVDYLGEYERSFGSYLDLLHGHDYRRFSGSYGLNISKYSYYKRYTGDLYPQYVDTLIYSKIETRAGLSFSAVYRFSEYASAGIKYLPSFYTFSPGEFRYGHFLFLDLAINFRINTKRGKTVH